MNSITFDRMMHDIVLNTRAMKILLIFQLSSPYNGILPLTKWDLDTESIANKWWVWNTL